MTYAVWYSLFMALWPALLWVGIFHLLPKEDVPSPLRRAVLAVLLALNGLTLSTIGFPHVESFIPALFFAGIACWLGLRGVWGQILALFAFAIMLSVREDAGLHACLAFAALALAAFSAKNTTLARGFVFLAAVSFSYSAAALALQKFSLPDGGQALGRVYLCYPILAHVDGQMLLQRLIYWAAARSYLRFPCHSDRSDRLLARPRLGARGCTLPAVARAVSAGHFADRRRPIWILFRAVDVWVLLAVAPAKAAGSRERRTAGQARSLARGYGGGFAVSFRADGNRAGLSRQRRRHRTCTLAVRASAMARPHCGDREVPVIPHCIAAIRPSDFRRWRGIAVDRAAATRTISGSIDL